MPKLPTQRGFYDDIRGFQRKDVKVQTEAFAPTRGQQIRTQFIAGILLLGFLGGALSCRMNQAKLERNPLPQAGSPWEGVSVRTGGHLEPADKHGADAASGHASTK